jgi:hypothetical protein
VLALLGEPRVPIDYPLPAVWRFVNADERWLRAEQLRALGRDDEALRWYASYPDPATSDLAYVAPSYLRRGEL